MTSALEPLYAAGTPAAGVAAAAPPPPPIEMLGRSAISHQQIAAFLVEKVATRRAAVQKSIHAIVKLIQEILKDVEQQEPRFIPTLLDNNGRYEGFSVLSPDEYEVVLYLNQMGVFNFVDDGSVQGCAVLKLSDGRKRSMSLWVEFITASGYLSARKIRSRFAALVAQTLEKPAFRESAQLVHEASGASGGGGGDVRIRLYDKFVVRITCAFRCNGIWPRSASHWPTAIGGQTAWPHADLVKEVRYEGFDLLSKDVSLSAAVASTSVAPAASAAQKAAAPSTAAAVAASSSAASAASSMEGDAWAISMTHAEDLLLGAHTNNNRHKTFTILKTLRDRHLSYANSPITNYIMKTLVLYECEKHVHDHDWHDYALGDRVIGVLLQLVSCLQCRRCPHYFLSNLDLFRGRPPAALEMSAKTTWALVRRLLLSECALEAL